MSRKPLSICKSLVVAATLTLGAANIALADDSSMSRLTGDSYAFFNDLDYSLGKFNTPRAKGKDAVAKAPAKTEREVDPSMVSSTRQEAGKPTGPIRDDRGT